MKSILCAMLLCAALMSCESKSGRLAEDRMAQRASIKPVKIVLYKMIKEDSETKTFKIRTIPSDSITHIMRTSSDFSEGDTLMRKPMIDFN